MVLGNFNVTDFVRTLTIYVLAIFVMSQWSHPHIHKSETNGKLKLKLESHFLNIFFPAMHSGLAFESFTPLLPRCAVDFRGFFVISLSALCLNLLELLKYPFPPCYQGIPMSVMFRCKYTTTEPHVYNTPFVRTDTPNYTLQSL